MDSRRAASAVAFAAALFLTPEGTADIAIDVTALASRPPREVRSMMGEASALWRPLGVTLTWIGSPAARALPGARRALDVVPCDAAVRGASWLGASRLGGYIKRVRLFAADQTSRYIQELGAVLPRGTRMTRPAGGNLAWVQLPHGVDGTRLYQRLLQQGIGIFPGEIFSAGAKHRGFVRIGCGLPWTPAIERAVGLIGRTCHELMR